MKKILILAASACLFAAQSCVFRFTGSTGSNGNSGNPIWLEASGDVVSKADTLGSSVNGLSVRGPFEVRLLKGDGPATVNLTCSSNLVDYFEAKVEGETLVLKLKDGTRTINLSDFLVTVTMPECRSVAVLGSGDVSSDALWDEDKFEASVTGSGNMYLTRLGASWADFTITGSGNIQASMAGHASSVTATCSGSGDMSLDGIDSDELSASISGSGNIALKGKTSSATYRISGSGDIDASGLASGETSSKVTGSGKVHTGGDD